MDVASTSNPAPAAPVPPIDFLANTTLVRYTPDALARQGYARVDDVRLARDVDGVQWLNTYGLECRDEIRAVIRQNGLDDFLLKLFADSKHPSKVLQLDDDLFVAVRVLHTVDATRIEHEQMIFVATADFVWSVQEKHGDQFDGIRERLDAGKGMVRRKRADYLLFLLLESIVDDYQETYRALDEADPTADSLSDVKPTPEYTARVETQRRRLLSFQKATMSLRDTLTKLEKVDLDGFETVYFAELKEQTFNLISDIEFDVEEIDAQMNLIFSIQGHRLNEVMKTLTIFSVIFIPLTFLAGIYGMNFEYIPELRFRNGYFVLLGVMLIVTVGTVAYVRSKRWF